MSTISKAPNQFTLKNGRLSYPQLFEPKAGKANDNGKAKKKYSASLILCKTKDAEQRKAFAAAIKSVAAGFDKWKGHHVVTSDGKTICGTEGQKKLILKGIPLRDGAERADKLGYDETKWFVNASVNGEEDDGTILPPIPVLNKNGQPLDRHNRLVFGGCYAHMSVRIWCQDNDFGRRINLGLVGVMYAGPGEPFGNGGPADAESLAKGDFAELVEEEDTSGTAASTPAGTDPEDDL